MRKPFLECLLFSNRPGLSVGDTSLGQTLYTIQGEDVRPFDTFVHLTSSSSHQNLERAKAFTEKSQDSSYTVVWHIKYGLLAFSHSTYGSLPKLAWSVCPSITAMLPR